MKAIKANKEYVISKADMNRYLGDGFDIYDDNGTLVKSGKGKNVSYDKYEADIASKDANGTKICLGGTGQTRHAGYNTTILIHWTRDPVEAEAKAREVFALFFGKTDFYIADTHVYISDPGLEPISVGKDQYEICEYVINLKLIYER